MKKNVMVVCGNSIEDLENGVQAMKQALAAGAVCGVGGTSLEEVEAGLRMAKALTRATPSRPHKCNCDCGGVCDECDCDDLWDEEEGEEPEEEYVLQGLAGQMVQAMIEAYEGHHRK